jgi:hypothetical protein
MRFGRDKLVFMGLVALDEVAERCASAPYKPPFSLRVVLAMLYAFSNGDRTSFDRFWRACQMPDEPGHREHQSRIMRRGAVGAAYAGICKAVGCDQTVNFVADISAARREPLPQAKAYRKNTRINLTKADADRQRFADAVRAAGALTGDVERPPS